MGARHHTVSHPAPTRGDHLHFCEVEGWRLVRSAVGKRSTHHETYELELPDGSVLRTRISRPPDSIGYGAALWSHILRDQLQFSPEEFWQCAQTGTPPDRGAPSTPDGAVPTDLLYLLKNRVGLTDEQLAEMDKRTAIERAQRYWTTGR